MTEEKQLLVEQNITLAHYIAKSFISTNIEFDELKSLAYTGLVKAANAYDPDKGWEFSTLAGRVMRNEILLYMRNNRKHLHVVASLDAEIFPEEEYTLKDIIPGKFEGFDNVEQIYDFKKNIENLNTTEKRVIQVKLDNCGGTQEELGALLNMSQSYVSRVMNRIRRKMVTT